MKTPLLTLSIMSGLYLCPNITFATSFPCMIQPAQIVEIRSPITGMLQNLSVKAGDSIRKGQKLAQIEASVEKSATQTAQYRTQLSGAKQTALTKIQYAQNKTNRMKELYAENFVSRQAYDDDANELGQARAELKVAQEKLNKPNMNISKAKQT